MKVKLKSKPVDGGDYRKNIAKQERTLSRKIAKMVFDMNPTFTECWVSFFSGDIRWFTDEPTYYYVQNSYIYEKVGEVK